MPIAQNFPALKPTLNLDFANVKALDPRITFTRASEGRFWDGKTFAKAEENLLLQSQDFTNAVWSNTRSTDAANTDTAPDGTVTADSLLQETGQTTSGLFQQGASVVAAEYVVSVFAKPNGKNFLRIAETLLDGTVKNTWFNVSTGVVGTTAAGHTASISASTNSYYRCTVRFTANAARSGNVFLALGDTDNSVTVTDSGGLFLWGAQLEQRSAVTAYTPTTTQPITRYQPVLQTAAANVARFDHNPVTGESLGLLIEEQRTNLLTRSAEFDNASWSKIRSSVTQNAIVAPDGALTADKMVEDTTASATHVINLTAGVTIAANTAHTFSCFLKAGERTRARILYTNSGSTASYAGDIDLSAGTIAGVVIAGSPTSTSASITNVGNGWFRCSITALLDVGSTTGNIQINLRDAGGNTSYTGDGFSGIFIWGAQLEAGAMATSYIPTVASQVTRQADAASMTGVNFSSWYRQDEGSLYVEAQRQGTTTASGFPRLASINDGTSNNEIAVLWSNLTSKLFAVVTSSAATQADMNYLGQPQGSSYRTAAAYKANEFAFTANSAAVQTDATGVVPVVSSLSIGGLAGTGLLNGTIRRVAFYPQRLTNTQLQAITS